MQFISKFAVSNIFQNANTKDFSKILFSLKLDWPYPSYVFRVPEKNNATKIKVGCFVLWFFTFIDITFWQT